MDHEDLARSHHVKGSSDRAFGFVFAIVFSIIAAWPLLSAGNPRWWAAALACVFALLAMVRPTSLTVLNRYWIRLGLMLGAIVSPIALGVLFYGVFTPIGALMRLAGMDTLRLKREERAASYWLGREPPGPRPDSMGRQF